MSDKNDKVEAGNDLVVDAAIFSPPVVWGAVLGPIGFITGAVATGFMLAAQKKANNSEPKRPDPNDPA